MYKEEIDAIDGWLQFTDNNLDLPYSGTDFEDWHSAKKEQLEDVISRRVTCKLVVDT